MANKTKTKKQERAEKNQRYSTIDHHLDIVAAGGSTVKQPRHFGKKKHEIVLTPLARRILETHSKDDDE